MKQVVQSLKTGQLSVSDVPSPQLRSRGVLVRNCASLVSAGTERMLVDFAEKNLLQKAQARPDLVRQVVDKVQREGLLTTIDAVSNRFEQPLPLGYSSAGIVVEVGHDAHGYKVGDRVVCAGSGYATHSEIVFVPRNMVAKLPDNVAFEAGAFTTIGAIALQGVRLAEITLGSKVVVIGLGLLGQIALQLLRASGCRVMGLDLNPQRVELARQFGFEAWLNDDGIQNASTFTSNHGFDAVILTADTQSNGPVEIAGELARDRAIVVAIGVSGMTIPRKPYYEKELDFRISRSYGPGRYDPEYEEKGNDYPIGYVRWTQQRNMDTFAQLLSTGQVDVAPLITHRFKIDETLSAYDVITGKTQEAFLGVILQYDSDRVLERKIPLLGTPNNQPQAAIQLGLIGSGLFANNVLLPAMKVIEGLSLRGIMSGSGLNARFSGDRFGFAYATSSFEELLADSSINWVAILTRHNQHAEQAILAMRAGKDVYVEKPLALNEEELSNVMRVQQETGQRLVVGFNRRFAPMIVTMRKALANHKRPLMISCRVNAGAISQKHWTQDTSVGGGRIIGEACHFIDLICYLLNSTPVSVFSQAIETAEGLIEDECVINLRFEDGSVGLVIYTAGGDKGYGKERIECFGNGSVIVMDDYRRLDIVKNGKRATTTERLRPNKGHKMEWTELTHAVLAGTALPISNEEIIANHLATFAAVKSLKQGLQVNVNIADFQAGLVP